jgi:uncharacterized protein
MKLDLRKLKRSGKDREDFFFEYLADEKLVDIPECNFDGAVKITGTITLTGEHSCLVSGEVEFTLKGECTRCLSDAVNTYVAEFSEALEENNPDGYSVKNDMVDLTVIVDDVIAMNIPVSFLCREDCKGLCAGCGTNLNDGECKCKN